MTRSRRRGQSLLLRIPGRSTYFYPPEKSSFRYGSKKVSVTIETSYRWAPEQEWPLIEGIAEHNLFRHIVWHVEEIGAGEHFDFFFNKILVV